MQYFLNGKFLFIDSQHYTHAVFMGDRLLFRSKSYDQAVIDCERVKQERINWLNKLKEAQVKTVTCLPKASEKVTATDVKKLYPTDAQLYAAIERQKKIIDSIRIEKLTVKE